MEGGVLGHPASKGLPQRGQPGLDPAGTEVESRGAAEFERSGEVVANPNSIRRLEGKLEEHPTERGEQSQPRSTVSNKNVADSSGSGCKECDITAEPNRAGHSPGGSHESRRGRAAKPRMGGSLDELSAGLDRGINPLDALAEYIATYPQPALLGQPQYDWEPPRVATKVPDRVPRLKALGNAVDPLQIYPIMYAIKQINTAMRWNQ